MNLKKQKKSIIKEAVIKHIESNLKDYIIITIFLIIGVIIGVIFVNNLGENQKNQIGEYINQFITSLKTDYQIDNMGLLKKAMINNSLLSIIIWFAGACVIGLPIVYGIVAFKGFCLGYTISAITLTLAKGKSILFIIRSTIYAKYHNDTCNFGSKC